MRSLLLRVLLQLPHARDELHCKSLTVDVPRKVPMLSKLVSRGICYCSLTVQCPATVCSVRCVRLQSLGGTHR